MDVEKLLSSFEKLFYNLVILFLLIPITVYTLYRNHRFPADFVNTEYDKKPEERHTRYVSPVILMVGLFVFPLLVMENYMSQFAAQPAPVSFYSGWSLFEKTLLLTLVSTLFPLLSALTVLVYQKKSISSETLLKPFYAFMYSYAYAPVSLGIVLYVLYIVDALGYGEVGPPAMQAIFLVIFIVLVLGWIRAAMAFYHTFLTIGQMTRQRSLWTTIVTLAIVVSVSLIYS